MSLRLGLGGGLLALAFLPLPVDGQTVRVEVETTGLYRVAARDAAALIGHPTSALSLSFVPGPVSETDSTAVARQSVGLVVDDGGDGQFDAGDHLLFFAEAPSRWVHEEEQWRWRHNPYTAFAVYWLSASGPGGAVSLSSAGGQVAATGLQDRVAARLRVEVDRAPTHIAPGGISSGTAWHWESMQPGQTARFRVQMPAPSNPMGMLRLGLQSRGTSGDRLVADWDGVPLGPIDTGRAGEHVWETAVENLSAGGNDLRLRHLGGSQLLIDWIELFFTRSLSAEDGYLLFEAEEGVSAYETTNWDEPPLVLAIAPGGDLRVVRHTAFDAATGRLRFADSDAGPGVRYGLIEAGRWLTPPRVVAIDPDRLQLPAGAEYVVIAPSAFAAAAASLAAWRGRDARFAQPLTTAVVDIEAIYDAFTGGLPEPVAIRNFVRHAVETTAGRLRFVVLLGDGSYDYRGLIGEPPFVPPYEQDVTTQDEWFVRIDGPDALPDAAIGRLPARSAAEALALVDKIVDYERSPASGPWQGRAVLVADDTFNADRPGIVETEFIEDAELLARQLPPRLDVDKIYLSEHTREGRFKPSARTAFLDAFRTGAALLVWIGHGNSNVFAHEHIFVSPRDVATLDNGPRLPLLYAAASQMGTFDDPRQESVPEELLRHTGGGVVAMIAATRIGFHASNVELARLFHERLFADGRGHVPIGQALTEAKRLARTNRDNLQRYSLFGDPGTRLNLPRLDVRLQSPDSLRALDVVRIAGQVFDAAGQPVPLHGTVRLRVSDAVTQRRLDEQGASLQYLRPGAPLYRGDGTVVDGRFALDVPIPKDITYGGQSAAISAFVTDGRLSGFGTRDSLVVSGTSRDVSLDDDGPTVEVSFRVDGRVVPANRVSRDAEIHIVLRDDSGINVTGDIGHGIVARIDGRQFDLTGVYVARQDYRIGDVRLALPSLSDGDHDVRIDVWDTRNNWTESVTPFRVDGQRSALREVRFHPSPLEGSLGHFVFEVDAAGEARIDVYALSGRRVDRLDVAVTQGWNQVAWHVPDDLANGTYLYRIAVAGNAHRGALVVRR